MHERAFCNLLHRGTGAHCHDAPNHQGRHLAYAHFPAQLVSWEESVRQDKLGRRIGYNWWREYITGLWRDAYDAWYNIMEEETSGYETEMREYRRNNPSPKFKDFLISHAGQHARPA